VALFNVNSAQSTRSLSVPFGFRNVAWYPLVSSSSFSLVGITHDWKVVVLGDNIHIPKDEGSISREIATHSAPQRRTLFQDIFGKSAFGEQASASQSLAPASLSRPWTGREGAGVFDEAAYLMPPLEKLFEPLMNGFLKPRAAEVSVVPSAITANEDVDMDGEGRTATVSGVEAKRVVDPQEMDAMIDLFRTHTLKGMLLVHFFSPSFPNVQLQPRLRSLWERRADEMGWSTVIRTDLLVFLQTRSRMESQHPQK
jgi:NET1-associated nuclear protein 1 (U3 small nucleolar RNA-associated protein 17)